jgi:CRP-like cAMP-binding protein
VDAALLRAVPFLSSLTEDQLASIARLGREERIATGTTIFQEDTRGDAFYVVLSGRVRIVKHLAGGGQEALTFIGPGGHFGEMALIDDFPRSASAVAQEESVVSVISKDALRQILAVDRDLAVTILWGFVQTLSQRLRDTNDKLKAFFAFTGGF